MLQMIRTRLANSKDRGASAVEYGLLVAGIAAVVVAAVFFLGGAVRAQFDTVGSEISNGPTN